MSCLHRYIHTYIHTHAASIHVHIYMNAITTEHITYACMLCIFSKCNHAWYIHTINQHTCKFTHTYKHVQLYSGQMNCYVLNIGPAPQNSGFLHEGAFLQTVTKGTWYLMKGYSYAHINSAEMSILWPWPWPWPWPWCHACHTSRMGHQVWRCHPAKYLTK